VSVVVVGLNERDAPLELLERLAISDRDLPKVLASLCDSPHLSEAVVVSTCLRTEVYAVLERFHDGLADIQSFFESRLGPSDVGAAALEERLLVDYDDEAARHLFGVAAGIDSAVLGEGEILRQVRHAAEKARLCRASGPVLSGLFRHALEVGKRARAETGIARGTTSLAHVAVALVTERAGGSLKDQEILVIGAGEMGEGVLQALGAATKQNRVVVANRSLARANVLASRVGARAISMSALHEEMANVDIVITATASDQILLDVDDVSAVLANRGGRPLIVVDAAMPRDIDPAVGELEGLTLLDVGDLRAYAEKEMQTRRGEIARVVEIIDDELERYRVNSQERSVAPVIAALRSKAEAVRESELKRFQSRIGALDEDAQGAVEALTRGIVAKLLHDPTVQVKQEAGSARSERLAEALRALFDL
jgi:glutamyl-tRNA reductase